MTLMAFLLGRDGSFPFERAVEQGSFQTEIYDHTPVFCWIFLFAWCELLHQILLVAMR